jgi:hypothetical protein
MQSYFLVTCKMCNYIKQTTKDSFSSSGLGVMFITKTTQDSKIKDILKSASGFDALPSPGVNPLEGSPKCSCGKLGLGRHSRLPTLKGGRGSSWEPRD